VHPKLVLDYMENRKFSIQLALQLSPFVHSAQYSLTILAVLSQLPFILTNPMPPPHTYRNIGTIISLHILMFMFVDSRKKTKCCGLNCSKNYSDSLSFNFILHKIVTGIPKNLNCATFSKDLLGVFML
jgi:hypothetical protein